ncbi:Hypothetical predicted protein [Octopus vulgaris]|uniref:Uncharacterized protein n=1 Tax=Octopus vulgaris TaxID=6645 RepID=A0AA36BZN7_OCTVU|nr:Hypothetical predicted protein [Octopus vulgaris]
MGADDSEKNEALWRNLEARREAGEEVDADTLWPILELENRQYNNAQVKPLSPDTVDSGLNSSEDTNGQYRHNGFNIQRMLRIGKVRKSADVMPTVDRRRIGGCIRSCLQTGSMSFIGCHMMCA